MQQASAICEKISGHPFASNSTSCDSSSTESSSTSTEELASRATGAAAGRSQGTTANKPAAGFWPRKHPTAALIFLPCSGVACYFAFR